MSFTAKKYINILLNVSGFIWVVQSAAHLWGDICSTPGHGSIFSLFIEQYYESEMTSVTHFH